MCKGFTEMNLKSLIITMAASLLLVAVLITLEVRTYRRRQRLKDSRPPIDPRTIIKVVKDQPPMTRMPERDERK